MTSEEERNVALKGNDVNWFRPLWRRVAVTAVLAIWLVMELFVWKDGLFQVLVAAFLVYALYSFFYAFPKEDPANEQLQPPPPPEGEDGPRS